MQGKLYLSGKRGSEDEGIWENKCKSMERENSGALNLDKEEEK